jgi:hypothetical protein
VRPHARQPGASSPASWGLAAAGLAVALGCAPARRPDAPAVRRLDTFDDLTAWRALGSDGVTASLSAVPGVRGGALRLALDFAGTSGYAVARRALVLALPADFELSFELRGDVPPNHLEVKLIDASGDNVWWFRRPDFAFSTAWRRVVIKRRQIEFAWGPTADRRLREIAAIEVVVASGQGGGKGWIEVDDLAIEARPVDPGPPAAPRAVASSAQPGGGPALAIDGDPATAWASDPAAGAAQQLTLDLGRERELGGVVVQWAGDGFATNYAVELSRDGATWQPAGAITGGNGGLDPLWLPEATARFVRLRLARGHGAAYRLAELAVIDVEAGATANGFVAALARRAPRGSYPRGFSGEQVYWTVVGVDGGRHPSLLSEDGALELGGGATLEPFVEDGGRITSWATLASGEPAGTIDHGLADGYLPIPSVTWRTPAWSLDVTALATGDASAAQLAARYTLRNLTDRPRALRLVLAVRPFQVNPPTQWLNLAGGVRRIERIAWDGARVGLDGAAAVHPLPRPDRVGVWPLHAGGYPFTPVTASATTAAHAVDPAGLASGALAWDLVVAPRAAAHVVVSAPLFGAPPARPGGDPEAWFAAALAASRAAWHARLDRVGFRVPDDGRPLVATLRSSLAYMLVSRDGPILRPGTRSYARAWIRDGAMIGEALLRLGHAEVASAFLRWYAPYQFASGKVPCCVDRHGAVPVPEHDSHGELIFLAGELYRYTRDRDQLAAVWPNVQAAAGYLEQLRQSERVAANQTAARRARYGLLPPSISHEGYSAKPAYSYWDNFWGLTGYKSAAAIAVALGDAGAAGRYAAQADELRGDLIASITASAADHRVAYIPGAADLGDFDPTSTTIALTPAGELAALPAALVAATFERAWQAVVARRPGGAAWTDYTPYELRLIGAFVRLGWRARAGDALAQYLGDRRPAGWNQWAEVVGRAPREPRFLGDMPHAWVHSDYARSMLDLFAYERAADQAIVLAAGIAPSWFAGDGFAIEGLATPYGALSYDVRATDRAITLTVAPGPVPPGGLVFPWPLAQPPGATRINGKPARWHGAALALTIAERPATITIARAPAPP